MTNTLWRNIVRGVAFGDSWGDPTEFASITSLTENAPQGPDLPRELRITDDTQMTLYLASALDETWGAPVEQVKAAIIEAYLTYADDPDNNRAPGITVMGSLGALKRSPARRWQGTTSTHSDGSGTVMRTTPTAFLPEDRWVGATAFAAAVTHGTANAIAAAILNVALLREAMAGKIVPGTLVSRAAQLALEYEYGGVEVGEWLDGYEIDLTPGFAELVRLCESATVALDTYRSDPWAVKADPSLQPGLWDSPTRGGGWRGHQTLVIALLACDLLPGNPAQALRRAVVTDGDSDTIGAVAGGLLGALYPGVFLALWDEYRDRFEPRYVRWIEMECDDYPFADPRPRSLLRRLLRI